MRYPFTVCTSKATILGSDLGQWIRKLDLPDTCDEELYICLFFMKVLGQGESHPAYYSLKTAQPPDLPLGWTVEEVEIFQDRYTIECVRNMQKFFKETFEMLYPKILEVEGASQIFF